MGHQYPGIRVVPELRSLDGDAGWRPVQLLHRLVSAPRRAMARTTPTSGNVHEPELPAYLQANHGINPNGNAVVGLSMAGSAALTYAIYYPQKYIYASSPVRLPQPSEGWWPMLIGGDERRRRVQRTEHVGTVIGRGLATQRSDDQHQSARGQHPHLDLLRNRNPVGARYLRRWGNLMAAQFLEGFTLRTNKTFMQNYLAAGGKNGVFNFRPTALTAGVTGARSSSR